MSHPVGTTNGAVSPLGRRFPGQVGACYVSLRLRLLRMAGLRLVRLPRPRPSLMLATMRYRHSSRWIFGALGSKGELFGSQYLAGRRAPPLLLG